jgi:FG-GAP-like repeat
MARGTRRAHVRLTRRSILLACLGFVLAAGVARSTSTPVPSFAAKKSYRTGPATLVGIADLNGNGSPDLFTLEAGRLSVFLNRGDGTFRPRSDYQAGPSPDASALADLNGDGRPDLVTANRESGTVSVLLNRGDGSFGIPRDFSTGSGRSSGALPTLAIADLNGDGKPDLVVGHGNVVSVLLGNGDGSFQPKQDYGAGGLEVTSVAVADLNGDGKPDLVAAAPLRIFVFLGNGDGTFRAPHDFSGEGDSLAIADLNGDGRPDLVVWAGAGGCCVLPVSVFLNRGDGSFGLPRTYVLGGGIIPPSGGPISAQIADLNGDGKPDLVTVDDAPTDHGVGFSVLLNRGDGTFGSRSDYRAAGDFYSIAISDVNGDGRPDLAIAAVSNLYSVSLFLNKGQGRFQVRRDYRTDSNPGDIAIADLNGDGRPDVLTTNYSAVSVLLNRPGLCNVQDVQGMRPAVAKWRLARVNCRAVIRRVFDPKRDRPVEGGCGCGWAWWPKGGLVSSQRPNFGAVLPAGGKVRLVVRFGRRG